VPYLDDFNNNFGSFSGGNDLIQEVAQAEVRWSLEPTENLRLQMDAIYCLEALS
jgi:hypothetical protein